MLQYFILGVPRGAYFPKNLAPVASLRWACHVFLPFRFQGSLMKLLWLQQGMT